MDDPDDGFLVSYDSATGGGPLQVVFMDDIPEFESRAPDEKRMFDVTVDSSSGVLIVGEGDIVPGSSAEENSFFLRFDDSSGGLAFDWIEQYEDHTDDEDMTSSGRAITTDNVGDIYITGFIAPTSFPKGQVEGPTGGPCGQANFVIPSDMYVAKFRPNGVLKGDVNCDGVVDLSDVCPFVAAAGSGASVGIQVIRKS